MTEITLSSEQQEAISLVDNWWKRNNSREYKLGGYAGTGKTTIIKHLNNTIKCDIEVCAFTGKAVSVLNKKACQASTIHSLIYRPDKHPKTGVITWHKQPYLDNDLFIIDEASMISRALYDDLLSYNIPILWIGDPGQLEPVGDDIGLMKNPDFTLQQIHRQAAGNGILDLATAFRQGSEPKDLSLFKDCKLEKMSNAIDVEADQIICGYNKTRVSFNTQVRKHLGRSEKRIVIGEKLICLRNNAFAGIFNGMILFVDEILEETKSIITIQVKDELDQIYGPLNLWTAQLNSLTTPDMVTVIKQSKIMNKDIHFLDYGYCLTAHKSQGSEWPRVTVIEEIWHEKWDAKRWRYTTVTRASESLAYYYKG